MLRPLRSASPPACGNQQLCKHGDAQAGAQALQGAGTSELAAEHSPLADSRKRTSSSGSTKHRSSVVSFVEAKPVLPPQSAVPQERPTGKSKQQLPLPVRHPWHAVCTVEACFP